MKRTLLSLTGAALAAGLAASPARAGAETFDEGMQPILAQYLKIQAALAGDHDKGVAKAAARIAKITRALKPKTVKGKHAAHYAKLPAKLKAAARAVAKAKGLKARREAFKALSRPMALWATMSKPKGVNVVFCSMAKASWLQRGKTIANPYYGSKMLRCGQVIGGKHKGHADGHMKH